MIANSPNKRLAYESKRARRRREKREAAWAMRLTSKRGRVDYLPIGMCDDLALGLDDTTGRVRESGYSDFSDEEIEAAFDRSCARDEWPEPYRRV